ncbi:hypothetical protein [Priestia aryabhattai]|uniref:hypothetical protein n=1 Tax=Priestia aryabhattai TaxID=412384 RepID=UPI002E225293|nr:hypothetical protein [Priestia aryabhattai]
MIVIEGKDSFDWVALTSAIISLLAVVVAIVAIWMQQKQFKKQREPVIAPAIKSFNLELPETHLDWDTGEELNDKFSNTTIPIYNYGGTTAFNIGYSYKFVNLNKIKTHLEHKLIRDNFNIKIEAIDEKEKSFDLVFTNETKRKRFHKIRPYLKRTDLIQSGDKVNIVLPSYFLVLINWEFQLVDFDDIQLPELELTLVYNDINNQKWVVKHLIKMDTYREYDGNELKSNFVSEFISKHKVTSNKRTF